MKHYIISDIHGCNTEYKLLLEKLNLASDDLVYILGDSIDRGDDPIKVLQDIMNRPNFIYILGNHEIMMMTAIRPLMQEITNESVHSLEGNDDLYFAFGDWMNNGGTTTLQQFMALERWEQEDILCFLEESSAYETIEYDGNLYILAHAGLGNFSIYKELDEYSVGDFVWGRTDYKKKYFPSDKIFLVTGHTPTPIIRDDKQPHIYTENGHIAIDCGVVYKGGRLAAYCVETSEAIYVDKITKEGNV